MSLTMRSLEKAIEEVIVATQNHWRDMTLSEEEIAAIDRLLEHPGWHGPQTREEFLLFATRVGLECVEPIYPI